MPVEAYVHICICFCICIYKLSRFCAAGDAAIARAALIPIVADEISAAVKEAATALRALDGLGGTELETANMVEQAALDLLRDARTTGSFLTNCFSGSASGTMADA